MVEEGWGEVEEEVESDTGAEEEEAVADSGPEGEGSVVEGAGTLVEGKEAAADSAAMKRGRKSNREEKKNAGGTCN